MSATTSKICATCGKLDAPRGECAACDERRAVDATREALRQMFDGIAENLAPGVLAGEPFALIAFPVIAENDIPSLRFQLAQAHADELGPALVQLGRQIAADAQRAPGRLIIPGRA